MRLIQDKRKYGCLRPQPLYEDAMMHSSEQAPAQSAVRSQAQVVPAIPGAARRWASRGTLLRGARLHATVVLGHVFLAPPHVLG
jgi:hypothetical protein